MRCGTRRSISFQGRALHRTAAGPARQLAVAMLASNVCELIVNDIPRAGTDAGTGSLPGRTTSVERSPTRRALVER